MWDCNGTAAQNWTIESDGTIRINGSCMDITGAGTANGTLVELWTCNGGANQQWLPVNGMLVNPVSGRCLDDPGFTTTNGTQLEDRDCNGGSNQQSCTSVSGICRMHTIGPGVLAQLAHQVLDGLPDDFPGLRQVDAEQAVAVFHHPAVDHDGVHISPLGLEGDVAVGIEQREHYWRGVVLDQHDVCLAGRPAGCRSRSRGRAPWPRRGWPSRRRARPAGGSWSPCPDCQGACRCSRDRSAPRVVRMAENRSPLHHTPPGLNQQTPKCILAQLPMSGSPLPGAHSLVDSGAPSPVPIQW